jgi:rhomboid protease GluP
VFERRRSGSTLCPSCGLLVGVNDARCFHCGRPRPGMWGFGPLLRGMGLELGLVPIVLWGCGALYLACLAVDLEAMAQGGNPLTLISPGRAALFLFGASGAIPVFGLGRWWTVLSAGWLHGGVLHIFMNLMAIRDLGGAVSQVYGRSRAIVIYTVAGAAGFAASSAAGAFLGFLPWFLRGGELTVGASASAFGLMGALMVYGRRGGSSGLTAHVQRWALLWLVLGLLIPGIDNWAHAGGLAGGYVVARWLDPLRPERGNHAVAAVICLTLSVLAVVASVVTGLPLLRGR